MKSYKEKMAQLKAELSHIYKEMLHKQYKFKDYQQAVYDFVVGKRSIIQFTINNQQYFVKQGNENGGFRHIIEKHYSDGCVGCITAKDILNMANVIRNGRELTDVEITTKGNLGFEQPKNGTKIRLIYQKDKNGNFIISLFSREELAIEQGDCF